MTDAARIAQLKGELSLAQDRVRELHAQLDVYRVKCPTCRCRILPGEECTCCASAGADDVEPLL